MRNATDGIVLYIAVSTDEAMELLTPASMDGRNVGEEVLPIRAAQYCMNLMIGSIHGY